MGEVFYYLALFTGVGAGLGAVFSVLGYAMNTVFSIIHNVIMEGVRV